METAKRALTLCYIPLALLAFFVLLQSIFFFGPFYIGNLAPLCVLLALTFLWAYLVKLRFTLKGPAKRVCRTLSFLCIAGFSLLILLTFWMGSKARSPKAFPQSATVLVLGCQVRSDGQVSEMLARRLDKAADYLLEHLDVPCIVTGGKGPREPGAEAYYMEEYLTQKGIDSSRIHTEPFSVNTSQNLAFSWEIMEYEGLPSELIIVTDGFHQARANYFAQRLGLTSHPLSSSTPWYLLPLYLLREYMALAKAFILHV